METQGSNSGNQSVYAGLMALLDTEYPKTCPRCGCTYSNLQEFVERTLPVHGGGTGLMGYDTGETQQQVAIYRNCSCGSTIATFCGDRRDGSPSGIQRRELFAQVLTTLCENGIDPNIARTELLAFLRGKPSAVIEQFGLGDRL